MIAVSIAVLVALFCLSAFFSGSESILFSLTGAQRERIRQRDPGADLAIARCVEDSAMLLSTLLVGNTFVNFAIATVGSTFNSRSTTSRIFIHISRILDA